MDAATPTITIEIAAGIPILISILALCVSVFTFHWARDARRRKLVDAAYWHIKFTQENLGKWRGIIDALPDKMRSDKEYTPLIVVPREDNLAYTDLIELMGWLKAKKQEETILRYFHAQANLHATAESFGKEAVRNLPLEQKIRIVNGLAHFCDETLKHAKVAEEILETKRKRKA